MKALVTKIGGVLPDNPALGVSVVFYDPQEGRILGEPMELSFPLTFATLEELNERIDAAIMQTALERRYDAFRSTDIIHGANNQREISTLDAMPPSDL